MAATSPEATTTAQLVWPRALTVGAGTQQLVLVPFAGDAALFAHGAYTGLRYLIVDRQASNALEGKIIEVLVPRASHSIDTLALFTSLHRGYQNGQSIAPNLAKGSIFLYSAD